MTQATMHTYRIWMKDGYARLLNAETEDAARKAAVDMTIKDCEESGMSPKDRDFKRATRVDYVDQLD